MLRITEGRPNILDYIKNFEIKLIINTPSGKLEPSDDRTIRSTAVSYTVPCLTNLAATASTRWCWRCSGAYPRFV